MHMNERSYLHYSAHSGATRVMGVGIHTYKVMSWQRAGILIKFASGMGWREGGMRWQWGGGRSGSGRWWVRWQWLPPSSNPLPRPDLICRSTRTCASDFARAGTSRPLTPLKRLVCLLSGDLPDYHRMQC